MAKHAGILVILLSAIPLNAAAQVSGYGPGYQMTMSGNPAVTGSEGSGFLRISYFNLYPGNGYNIHSGTISYDGYFPSLHGGAGIIISENYLGGIINDLKGSASYAYFFQADKDLYFSAGLSASFYHRGFSFNGVVLPDQIDPLGGAILTSLETLTDQGRTIFDLGTGFVFYTGKISGGIAVSHLAQPDLSDDNVAESTLNRSLFIHFTGDFEVSDGGKIFIQPSAMIELQKGKLSIGAGSAFNFNYLAVNLLLMADDEKNLDLQSGFSVTRGIVSLFYNYRFNLLSGQDLLPFSLLHHTGVVLRLNNVDKRKTVKTINFPKL